MLKQSVNNKPNVQHIIYTCWKMFKSKRVFMKARENVFGDRYNLHSVVEHDVKSSLKPFEQFLGNLVFIFFNVDFAIRLHLFKFWSNCLTV